MKKIFQYLGLFVFVCFAFFYTEKAVNVVKNMDDIMVTINNEKDKYYIKPIDAVINNNDIIPGVNGLEVDINESYLKMKKLGNFNSKMFIFNEIAPKTSSSNSYDKYFISGNQGQNRVSLIFNVKRNDNVDQILRTLQEKNIKVTFFLDGKWMEENSLKTKEIANLGHMIENYGYNLEYTNDLFLWTNDVIKKLGSNKPKYCLIENDNSVVLKICAANKMQTIKTSINLGVTPLQDVKKSLQKGSIVNIEVNDMVNRELSSIINYINQKGYSIVTLNELLTEKRN